MDPTSTSQSSAARPTSPDALLTRLVERRSRAAVTFAGQGVDALGELVRLVERRPELRGRLDQVARSLEELARSPAGEASGRFRFGLDVAEWVDDPEGAPPQTYLRSAAVSFPLILATQLLGWEALWDEGLGLAVEAGAVVAVSGHSQGLLAALAVAEEPLGPIDDPTLARWLRIVFHQGLHQAAASTATAGASGRRPPSGPMAVVSGVRLGALEEALAEINALLTPDQHAVVSLVNSVDHLVVSGPPATLDALRDRLTELAADQVAARRAGRPLSDGLGEHRWEPLAVEVPFHSPQLAVAQARHAAWLAARPQSGLPTAERLTLPVLLSSSGRDLRQVAEERELADLVCHDQFVAPVRWDVTVEALREAGADWVLDCGPGTGLAGLTARNLRGHGPRVLPLATPEGRRLLFTPGAAPLGPDLRYQDSSPQLVSSETAAAPHDMCALLPRSPGVHLENRYTRATGQPPVVLPGMTPTTADVPIVAAAANAGFTAELAGGGQPTEWLFRTRMDELVESLRPGSTVVFNTLYLDRSLWELQVGQRGLVFEAKRSGVPLVGLTVSAGVPPSGEAVTLLDRLVAAGMVHNAFKPGTIEQVRQVAAIADAAPHHTIFVHLEGGRAGGHHSYEDLEELLLTSYHELRLRPNMVLCVGGGVGAPERAADLLTGEWSRVHGEPAMPVDAVLVGTAAMACAEATASPQVKRALVAAGGTEEWVPRRAAAGGVRSSRSSLDADIHVLDNTAARVGELLAEVAGDAAAVAERRDEIVAGLSRTAKPYFGDVEAMTYCEVLNRFTELAAIGRRGRYDDGAWGDPSWRSRALALYRRFSARLAPEDDGWIRPTIGRSTDLDDPAAALSRFVAVHPTAETTMLHPGDGAWFLEVCAGEGKPVPFVPVLDAEVRRWYLADALWQAQDDRYDAEAVLVIPGPTAVAGITRADEPVADLLARFERATVERVAAAGVVPERRDRLVGQGLAPPPLATAAEAGSGPLAALCVAPVLSDPRPGQPGRGRVNPLWELVKVGDDAEADVDEHGVLHRLRVRPAGGAPGEELHAELADGSLHLALVLPGLDQGDDCDSVSTLFQPELLGSSHLRGRADRPARGHRTVRSQPRTPSPTARPPSSTASDPAAKPPSLGPHRRDLSAEPLGPKSSRASAQWSSEAPDVAAYRAVTGAIHDGVPVDWAFSLAWPALSALLGDGAAGGGLGRMVHHHHRVTLGPAWPPRAGEKGVAETSVVMPAEGSLEAVVQVRSDRGLLATVEAGLVPNVPSKPAASGPHGLSRGRWWEGSGGRSREQVRIPGRAELEVFETAPADMRAFARIGGDHNPLHRSVLVARSAGLAGPIVHGMWTASRAEAHLVEAACDGDPRRLADWRVRFTAPVPLGAELRIESTPLDRDEGGSRWQVTVGLVTPDGEADDELAVVATAYVTPPRTVLVFPGQGVQRPGLAADGRARSSAAREVWQRCDAHTRGQMGFSLLDVVERNPAELRLGWGASGGAGLRHPSGVLHRTEITQVALVALAAAQTAELQEGGLLPDDLGRASGVIAAGHSVGELSALVALGVLSLEQALDLAYRRGRAMQTVVPRDDRGRSPFRLAAVDPGLLGVDLASLGAVVAEVAEQLGELGEVVNHNAQRQYVLAGTTGVVAELRRRLPAGAGRAIRTIDGIDVPFHSSVLAPAVPVFRAELEAVVGPVDRRRLVDRWVPNLLGRPFRLDPAFVAEVRELTGADIGSQDDQDELARCLLMELLAHQVAQPVRWIDVQRTLVLPEPAGGLAARRQVEIGPAHAPVLTDLAPSNFTGIPGGSPVEILHAERDRVRLLDLDRSPATEWRAEVSPNGSGTRPGPASGDEAFRPTGSRHGLGEAGSKGNGSAGSPPTAPPAPTAPIVDRPLDAAEAARLVLVLQARIRPDQLVQDETLDELFQGVSSRRNQVLIDLGRELGLAGADGIHEVPLGRLGAEICSRAPRYRFPGPYLRATLDAGLERMLGLAGLSQRDAVGHLTEHWGLPSGLVDRVLVDLVLGAREGTSARGGSFSGSSDPDPSLPSSPDEARALLDRTVRQVATSLGLDLRPVVPPEAAPGGTPEAVRELGQRLEHALVGAAEHLAGALGRSVGSAAVHGGDGHEPGAPDDKQRAVVLDRELGPEAAARLEGRFDPRRHVCFGSVWAAARWDLVALYHDALARRRSIGELVAEADRLTIHGNDPVLRAMVGWYSGRAREAARHDVAELLEPILSARRTPLFEAGGGPDSLEVGVLPGDLSAPVRLASEEAALSFVKVLQRSRDGAFDFVGEVALVTGASPGSIAAELVRQLLRGGATVVLTTSTDSPERRRWYRELYRLAAAPEAELHVLPANLASYADIDALIGWLADPRGAGPEASAAGPRRQLPQALVPTLVAPFAAMPTAGEAGADGSDAEIALRLHLLGVERLVVGAARLAGRDGGSAPVQVLLPLSPNHGDFGGDGVYGETKAALEVLVRRWRSEHAGWGRHVRMVPVRIGWVRGTGLMRHNDALAPLVEERLGICTFSAVEMGWLLAAALLVAPEGEIDLSGGLDAVDELRQAIAPLLADRSDDSPQRIRPDGADDTDDTLVRALPSVPDLTRGDGDQPCPHGLHRLGVSRVPAAEMVAIVGFGELGPCGTSPSRFALEVGEPLPPAAVVELAWLCGLVRYARDGYRSRWVDAADPATTLDESELAERYRDAVLDRVGLRPLEPDGLIDPEGLEVLTPVHLSADATFEVGSEAEARSFLAADPARTTVRRDPETHTWRVTRKAGAPLRVPRRVNHGRRVAGQLPTGLDLTRFGLSGEQQVGVDRLALLNLVCTAEAFRHAGIEPEELLQALHPAAVANTQGAGMGGMASLRQLVRDHLLDHERQSDRLQEALGNVVAAHVVQGLVGSYGPMVHPVAACATAAVSLEEAYDKIRSGKARAAVAGGYDDFTPEGLVGFGDMGATAASDELEARGLTPAESSRANDVRRCGFVEAQGGGSFLLVRGDVALSLGLPVRGVVVYAGSFGDGVQRSIPAPGLGLLAAACGGPDSPLATALARHGLDVDDIALVSKHDTSTELNDVNEADLHQRIQAALERTSGNPLLVVSPKTVTGHAKGGAAAWQVAGILQMMETGIVPGNRNLDSVDPRLRACDHLVHGDRPIRLATDEPIRAALVSSLGFGHVSALLALGHPDIFLAALSEQERADYQARAGQRRARGVQALLAVRHGRAESVVRAERPFGVAPGDGEAPRDAEAAVLLDPAARMDSAGVLRPGVEPVGATCEPMTSQPQAGQAIRRRGRTRG